MKKIFLFAAMALLPIMAQAEDAKPSNPATAAPGMHSPLPGGGPMGAAGAHPMGGPGMPGMTLEDARKRAHEMVDRLDKMTPAQWDEMQQQRAQMMSKFQSMTPEQRQQAIEKWKKEHASLMGGAPSKTAPAAAKPAAN